MAGGTGTSEEPVKGGGTVKKRLNRHAAKRKHKRILKQKYGYGLYEGYKTNLRLHEDKCREEYADNRDARNGGYEYWQAYYLTGPRQYAKEATNSVIRAMFRDILRNMTEDDMDEIPVFRGSDYEKAYDYMWTVW